VTWLVLVVRIDTWQRGSTRVSRSREWDCVMLHCRLPVAYNRLLVLHCIALHCIVLHRSLGGFLLLNSHLPSWLLMLAVPLEEGDLGPEILVRRSSHCTVRDNQDSPKSVWCRACAHCFKILTKSSLAEDPSMFPFE
jgi:hypothetical protein